VRVGGEQPRVKNIRSSLSQEFLEPPQCEWIESKSLSNNRRGDTIVFQLFFIRTTARQSNNVHIKFIPW
jgi:hypothetical protein